MNGIWRGLGGAVAASVVLLSACATPPPAASDATHSLEQRLDVLVPWLLERHRVPGAAVAVIAGGKTLVRGYGLRRAGKPDSSAAEPVGPDSAFEAASLGKPVFAYAMMQRALDGQLDLDRPLSESLDAPYIDGDERIDRITVRHVLSHTTGFPNWRPNRFTAQPGKLRIERDPGTGFGYSGEGYMLLQSVAARQTGQPTETFMQETLFRPLGMTRSGFIWTGRFAPDFVTPHDNRGEAGEKWWPRRAGVAYSLHTTASDFARFLEAMLTDGNETAKAMLVPQIEISSKHAWSLGWGIERRPDGDWFWQWGDNKGFKHFVMGSRVQRRAVLVLTNGDKGANVYRSVVEAALGFRASALAFKFIRY